jgi:hypothetical protein
MRASKWSPRSHQGFHDVALWVDGPHALAELAPKAFFDLFGHIQAPAVDAEAGPVLDGLEEVSAHTRVVGVQLGQRGQVPPGLVTQRALRTLAAGHVAVCLTHPALLIGRGVGVHRPACLQGAFVEIEPAPIRRGRAGLQDMMERPEAAPGVVEDPVDDHLHPALMAGVE